MPATQRTKFPPVFYAKYQVKGLTPAQLDELLANGWFRSDASVFTASVKLLENSWHSCVMLRVPLEDFTWKKRLRKLIRKNGELFTVTVQPFRQNEEKEAVWQHFKSQVHDWVMIPPLDKHLFRLAAPEKFNTWELCVHRGEKLVAFSIFDRGASSIASLEAAYDPAYRQHSLGLYTMLMEMEFAGREGMSYYYPGFYPKEVPMFEYKLRPGNVEFFRLKEKRWLPLEALEETDWLLGPILDKLDEAKISLTKKGLTVKMGYGLYPSVPSPKPAATAYNIMLVVSKKNQPLEAPVCLVAWDPVEAAFMVFRAVHVPGRVFWENVPEEEAVRLMDVNPYDFIGKFEGPEGIGELVDC